MINTENNPGVFYYEDNHGNDMIQRVAKLLQCLPRTIT